MMKPELLYYDLGPRVTAFSTTRHGGYSQGVYGEMNINRYCGDDPGALGKNHQALAQELGLPYDHILLPHQVHGNHCEVIDDGFYVSPIEKSCRLLEGADGLVTDQKDVCIGVSTADCIPILLYDLKNHIAAAVHAGWRGTVQRIVRQAIRTMSLYFRSLPENLRAVIGPGISLGNFEVGQEVYDVFAAAKFNMDRIARQYPDREDPSRMKWHIDLPRCNALQLRALGVPEKDIYLSDICTYDRVSDFFSARRLGPQSGRIYTGIILH